MSVTFQLNYRLFSNISTVLTFSCLFPNWSKLSGFFSFNIFHCLFLDYIILIQEHVDITLSFKLPGIYMILKKKKKHLWTFYILFNPPICVTYIYVWPVALKTTVNYSCLCSLPCKHMQSSDKLCAHTHSSPKKQIFFFKASKQQWFHTGFSIRVLMVVLKTAHFSNWAVFCSVNGPQTAPSYGMVERRLRQSTLLFIG